MAFAEAVGFAAVLFMLCYNLGKPGCCQTLSFTSEETPTEQHEPHHRGKRSAISTASLLPFTNIIEVDINVSDIAPLRAYLKAINFSQFINNLTEIYQIDITTVCQPNTTGSQCQCEDLYRWPCDKCTLYGTCDEIANDTCGCINAVPPDGTYCQAVSQTNFTACPKPTSTPTTASPILYEYLVDIDVNTTDLNGINILRTFLKNISYPDKITDQIQLSQINLSTVCYPNTAGFQCRCENQYQWPCDNCTAYGTCDDVTNGSCGCISALPPDGQYCQPIENISPCPTPTQPPTTTYIPTTMYLTAATQPPTTTYIPTTMYLTAATQPPTTMSLTTATQSPQAANETFTFTMDLTFNASFQDSSSAIYKAIDQVIKDNYKKYVKNYQSAELIGFRQGSVIAEYYVTAASFGSGEVANAQNGIVNAIGARFNIITESDTPLEFEPASPFTDDTIEVVCGPPPMNLNFTSSMTIEWKQNGTIIPHSKKFTFSQTNTIAMLTVNSASPGDSGTYDCTLGGTSVFHQSGNITVTPGPNIILTPIQAYVQCSNKQAVSLKCCVQSPFSVQFKDGAQILEGGVAVPEGESNCTNINYSINKTCDDTKTLSCVEHIFQRFSKTATFFLSSAPFNCTNDPEFGSGPQGVEAIAPCKVDEVGSRTAVCQNGIWLITKDTCVLKVLSDLFSQSQFLDNITLPGFLSSLSNATQTLTDRVVNSTSNIDAIVNILQNVATISKSIIINQDNMKDVLKTVDVLTSDGARQSWLNLNTGNNVSVNDSSKDSSRLLGAVENIADNLTSSSFTINTPRIFLNKTTFGNEFNADLNNSVAIDLLTSGSTFNSITTIFFLSFDNVLPVRGSGNLNESDYTINGNIVLVKSNSVVKNVSFTFNIFNKTLGNPQCVFWNFSLLQGLGGWDNTGCNLQSNANNTVSCVCTHLTSFSILMSPDSSSSKVLDIITYVGVGISMVCLVICLIIEAVVWNKVCNNTTSHMRHVSIVNIAVSLLLADIWFIIGASIDSKTMPACIATTFFIHFFYLCLFFWMLFSAMLLLNGTINVFSQLAKSTMMAIGFCLGYVAPLIIVIITIGVTLPNNRYIRTDGACWLNWEESRALLAFVIPALTIVFINFLIMIVVLFKILRSRGLRAQADNRHALVVIAKCLAVLTPLFGLTWGLGVGLFIAPYNRGINIAFAFFNSLQGFFILVFGTLIDKKVRANLIIVPLDSRGGTRSTTAGTSSGTGGFLQNLKRRVRGGYVTTAANSSAGSSGHFLNT